MSDIVAEVYTMLSSALSPSVGGRIHFGTMPPDAVFPLAVYDPIHDGDGLQASGNKGTWRMRFQVDLYAASPSAVLGLRKVLVLGLRSYSGPMIIRTRVDTGVAYYVEQIDQWRYMLDFAVDSELES